MTSDDSVYRPPGRSSGRSGAGTARSLEAAMAGDYRLDLASILSEAWTLTKGSKTVILGAAVITFAISSAGNLVNGLASATGAPDVLVLLSLLISLAGMAVSYGINAGTYVYAIKRASGDPSASFGDVFSRLPIIGPLFVMMLLYGVLVCAGFLLLVVPGIYLALGYVLALPLMAERGTGVWESLETSRKAIHQQWFTVLAVVLVAGVVVGVGGVLTLGIGLIWLWPWGTMVFAILYREIFGYSGRG
jgi:hypothetical protein